MGIKEIASRMFFNFFIVFFCIMFVVSVFSRFLGEDTISFNFVFSYMVLSFLIVLTEVVFYSKKELTRLQLLVRHLVCLSIIIVIALLYIGFVLGASFNEFSIPSVAINIGMIIATYTMTVAVGFIRTVKSTNQLEKKLKERYK